MKFTLTIASKLDFEKEIKLNSLQELIELIKLYGSEIIMDSDSIKIYDTFVE